MNLRNTWKMAEYQSKIWNYEGQKKYYQGLIDGYNFEKFFLCISLQRLSEMRTRLDRVTEQFEQCHQLSSARVGNTAGLQHINVNLVNRLATGMNDAVNGSQYQAALSGIWNQYIEIDAKARNKQNRVNNLDSAISQCNGRIRNCNNQIVYYQKKIEQLKAEGE